MSANYKASVLLVEGLACRWNLPSLDVQSSQKPCFLIFRHLVFWYHHTQTFASDNCNFMIFCFSWLLFSILASDWRRSFSCSIKSLNILTVNVDVVRSITYVHSLQFFEDEYIQLLKNYHNRMLYHSLFLLIIHIFSLLIL